MNVPSSLPETQIRETKSYSSCQGVRTRVTPLRIWVSMAE